MSLPPSLEEKSSSAAVFRQYGVILLKLLFASVITLALSQINLDYIESLFFDLRVRTRPAPANSANIHLILYDLKSSEQLKGELKAEHLSTALKKLQSSKPKHILLNISLEDIEGTDSQRKELAKVISTSSNVYALTDDLAIKGEDRLPPLKPPFDAVQLASAPRTMDAKIFAKDGVTRRMLISYQEKPLLHAQLAKEFNPEISDTSKIKGQFQFAGSTQTFIDFHPAGTFSHFSFQDILDGTANTDPMRDGIVIIGNDTRLASGDYILTPYSRQVTAMTTTEMHANMLDTLIRNSAPQRTPHWLNLLIIFFIALMTIHVVLTVKPTHGLLILGVTLIGYGVICYFSFWPLSHWLPMAAPLLTIFLCYYFFIPYRLIVENRRSWEYYQKNKLLSQVEELKTNFISMMSHDLKTPIARIQGMTDVILTDSVALSTQQREAVDTIKHSSDDLLKFINAILSYGRIESEGVQLNMQSKDINKLLEDVIRKHEFLAKVKRIQIVAELEPMFPVRVDAELMKQVFSNLVENAIKYSPEDTKILITSEESASKVIVQVADQGPGIPQDELQNIFMKFFRSKNAKSSPIKGSGLGLYLAKYFTELHRGHLFVESSHGNGSTFTVELPIEQGGTHA